MADALISYSFGIDTSDATATENDILKDVTAYTANGKVEGAIPVLNRNYDMGFDSIIYSVTDGKPAWIKSDGGFTHIGGSSIWESGGYITPGTAVDIYSPVADFIEKFEITSDKIVEGQSIMGVEGSAKAISSPMNFAFNTASQAETIFSFHYSDDGIENLLYSFNSDSENDEFPINDVVLIQGFSDGAFLKIANFSTTDYLVLSTNINYSQDLLISFILTAPNTLDSEIKVSVTELARNIQAENFKIMS